MLGTRKQREAVEEGPVREESQHILEESVKESQHNAKRRTALSQSEVQNLKLQCDDQHWKMLGGIELEEMLQHSNLLDVRYLIQLAKLSSKSGGRMPRSQDIPSASKITPDNVWILRLWTKHGDWGDASQGPAWSRNMHLPVVVLSYCWLSAEHPDPTGEQLQWICPLLESLLETAQTLGGPHCTIGLWQDYGSLAQAPRSEEEANRFKHGLKTINKWYMHPKIPVLKLAKQASANPQHTNRRLYQNRAWCFFESSASAIIKTGALVWDFSAYQPNATCRHGKKPACGSCCPHQMKVGRAPPLSPDAFEKQVREGIESGTLALTNKGDADIVINAFRTGFVECFESFSKLNAQARGPNYANLSWRDTDGLILADALRYAEAHCKIDQKVTIQLRYQHDHSCLESPGQHAFRNYFTESAANALTDSVNNSLKFDLLM